MTRKDAITREKMIEILTPEGYNLKEFRGNFGKTKHVVICDKGHEYECWYENFQRGYICKLCFFQTEKYTIEIWSPQNFKLKEFRGNGVKRNHLIECTNKHRYEVSYNSFQQGRICGFCAEKNQF